VVLKDRAAELKAQGERLRAVIRMIAEAHVGPMPLRAEKVLAQLPSPRELGRNHPPSLRTVWRHLRAIRERSRTV
jgi:hypothetical protein